MLSCCGPCRSGPAAMSEQHAELLAVILGDSNDSKLGQDKQQPWVLTATLMR